MNTVVSGAHLAPLLCGDTTLVIKVTLVPHYHHLYTHTHTHAHTLITARGAYERREGMQLGKHQNSKRGRMNVALLV